MPEIASIFIKVWPSIDIKEDINSNIVDNV